MVTDIFVICRCHKCLLFYPPYYLRTFTYWYSNMDIRMQNAMCTRQSTDGVDKIQKDKAV